MAPQSPRYLGKYMMTELSINKRHAKSILEVWNATGVIVSKPYDKRNKAMGVEVQFYP